MEHHKSTVYVLSMMLAVFQSFQAGWHCASRALGESAKCHQPGGAQDPTLSAANKPRCLVVAVGHRPAVE
jgi:hypothetical protein